MQTTHGNLPLKLKGSRVFLHLSCRSQSCSHICASVCCFSRDFELSAPGVPQILTNKSQLRANSCRRCLQIRCILTTAISQRQAPNLLSGQLARACELSPWHLLTFRGPFAPFISLRKQPWEIQAIFTSSCFIYIVTDHLAITHKGEQLSLQ